MPFCPECRTEYVEGTDQCDDCAVALVDVLPPDEAPKESADRDLFVVWTAPNEIEAQMIRTLLEGNRIECILSGESLRLTHSIMVDGLAEVRILVREEEASRAVEIIEEYERNREVG